MDDAEGLGVKLVKECACREDQGRAFKICIRLVCVDEAFLRHKR